MKTNSTKTGMTTKGAALLGLGGLLLPLTGALAQDAQEAPVQPEASAGAEERAAQSVDLAICLDTSGSMDQLLEAAKQKIWSLVNDFALAQPMPRLRVALLSFGNDGHSAENGWVEVLAPLTDDLDLVSQRLFERTTNGGTELVGRVVHRATTLLDWSQEPGALKIIVVAGNESADQDQEVSFRDACARAIAQDILVNAIYCGPPTDELAPAWREVARLADGQFAAIEHEAGPLVVSTPYDDELANLSSLLSATFIPLGEAGQMACSNMWAQDANAIHANTATAATRAQTKGGGLYVTGWDLVSACQSESVQLAEVKAEDLPEELRGKSVEELGQLVEQKAAERARIQTEIQALGTRRDAFVAQKTLELAQDPTRSFDFALRQAVRSQAQAKGLQFPVALPAPVEVAVEAPQAPVPLAPVGGAQQLGTAQQLETVQQTEAAQQAAPAPVHGRQAESASLPPSPYRRPPCGRG